MNSKNSDIMSDDSFEFVDKNHKFICNNDLQIKKTKLFTNNFFFLKLFKC
jgi:hypothetical protein